MTYHFPRSPFAIWTLYIDHHCNRSLTNCKQWFRRFWCEFSPMLICYRFPWNRVAMGNDESNVWDVVSHFHAFLKPAPMQWPNTTSKIIRELIGMGFTIQSFFRASMQPCKAMLKKCIWYNQQMPCEKLFYITKSVEGFCCSFNNLRAMKVNKWVLKYF